MTTQQRSNVIDIVAVFLIMTFGVAFSDQVLLAMKKGAGFDFTAPSWGKIILGFIMAGMLIGSTDLMQGDATGKLTARARVRRYSNALSNGVMWRLIMEAA